VLNLGMDAVRNLHMGNDEITFGGRFGGVPHEIMVPIAAVIGIFAKENGKGLVFQGQESELTPQNGDGGDKPPQPTAPAKSHLRVVK